VPCVLCALRHTASGPCSPCLPPLPLSNARGCARMRIGLGDFSRVAVVTVVASGGGWFPQAPAQAPAPFDMLAQDLKVRHALEMASQLAARAFRPPTAVPAPQSLAGAPGDLRQLGGGVSFDKLEQARPQPQAQPQDDECDNDDDNDDDNDSDDAGMVIDDE
jgi:hypothetical protein